MRGLVSIISPCYNGEKYIVNFLDSVLVQTYDNIELIVIDDASTDRTSEILKEYVSKFRNRGYRFIIETLSVNSGQAAAINKGLEVFSGDYITWMDSDDIFYKEAIRKKVEFLELHKECDYVLNNGEIVKESDLNCPISILKRFKPIGEDNFFKDLLDENNVVFGPGAVLVRTKSLRRVIPNLHIYESREGQNWQMMLPLAYSCKVGYLDEILFKYVVHENSHSHTKRTLEQENKRRDNFYKLQCETIDNITTMPSDEKKYWKKYAFTKAILAKYRMAINHHNFFEYLKLKNELKKQGVSVSLSEGFILNHFQMIGKKIRNRFGKKG